MKKLILISTCILLSFGALAQPHQNGEGNRKGRFERIKAEKIAFFTDRLDLTPEEAQIFWPVYNEYWKESQKAHKATMQAFKATKDDEGKAFSPEELEKRLDTYIRLASEEYKVRETFHSRFKEVLPLEKVAKLYDAEEAFRIKMLHSFGKPAGNGRKQHNGR